jgi:hypothetical protein
MEGRMPDLGDRLKSRRSQIHLVALAGALSAAALLGCGESTGPTLTVTAVSPSSGFASGGAAVTITGTNFIDVTSVTIGGIELASRTVVSTTQITVPAPPTWW